MGHQSKRDEPTSARGICGMGKELVVERSGTASNRPEAVFNKAGALDPPAGKRSRELC
jgi:hypothetical protein